jgi:hypothetical protein
VAAVATLALAGCGGGTGTSSTGGGEGRAPRDDSAKTEKAAGAGAHPTPAPANEAGVGTGRARTSAGAAPTAKSALPNQGTKAVAPGVPTSRGDNSIQTFGVESDSGERVQATATAAAYLRALGGGRWARACADLSASTRQQLGPLAENVRGSSSKVGCPGALRAFAARSPTAVLRGSAELRVLSLRVQGDRAFLIYEDGNGRASELPMSRSGGGWKVAAISGAALVL